MESGESVEHQEPVETLEPVEEQEPVEERPRTKEPETVEDSAVTNKRDSIIEEPEILDEPDSIKEAEIVEESDSPEVEPSEQVEPLAEPAVTEPTVTPISAQLPLTPYEMAEQELQNCIKQLRQALTASDASGASNVLSRAKISLLQLNALIPSSSTSTQHLSLARETLELGALVSIRLQDPHSFTRYFQQLQPFYAVDEARLSRDGSSESKITGLYLLLLLSQGDYAGFHTLLETLAATAQQAKEQGVSGRGLEDNAFIQYPIRLEQALMEGSYDRVWGETKSERVPSPEFSVFSEVLIGTIRNEIASCSERAYPSLPIANAKNLFFLESEGSVVQFAQQRGWIVKDGRVYFPQQEADLMGAEKDILVISGQVIENTLSYARELETIV